MESEISNLKNQVANLKNSLHRELRMKSSGLNMTTKSTQEIAVGTEDMQSSFTSETQLSSLENLLDHVQSIYGSQVHQTTEHQKLIAAEVEGIIAIYRETELENSKLKMDLAQLQVEKELWLDREQELLSQRNYE